MERSTIVTILSVYVQFYPTIKVCAPPIRPKCAEVSFFQTISVFPRTFTDSECRAPLISQNVQADAAVAVDVWVVDAGGEVDLRWLEWVVCWEVDREEEDAARVW